MISCPGNVLKFGAVFVAMMNVLLVWGLVLAPRWL